MAPQGRALILTLVLVLCSPARALAVEALFNLDTPRGGPFPSDRFTVDDRSHNTGVRVNLPSPDCQVRPSDCEDLDVINTLDGFNLQPRLSIPFDGPIDVNTVTSDTVFLVSLGSTLHHGDRGGNLIGINQVVWDLAATTLDVESDELLDQHAKYGLIVTRGVRDASGTPVVASEAFRRFLRENPRDHELREYRQVLRELLREARRLGIREVDVVAASVFTTLSATAILEKIRDQIKATPPAPADFLLAGGTRTVFSLSEVTSVVFNREIAVDGPLSATPVPVDALRIGSVAQIAFGRYTSPDYETPEKFIPPVGTRRGMPRAQGTNEICFNLFLPAGTQPPAGWPVAIFGHGFGDNKNSSPFVVGATMAAYGIATIAINVVGHGFGPLGTLTVNRTAGDPVDFSAGGRGIDQDGDGTIDSTEGVNAVPPRTIISNRDGLRQTVVDLMQLVRVIEVGMDVDGDGVADLDPTRIYYFGQSFGGIYGTKFLAVETDVRVGVPNVPGGAIIEVARLSPVFRPLVGLSLLNRTPSLLNPPGLTDIGGVPVGPPRFNENMPLRNQPPVINDVAGAIEIQEYLENVEWVSQSGNPVAYASHLRKDPLADVPEKAVIVQFAKGDQTVPNPTASAILRAGDLADRATFYRNDLAFAERPTEVPRNPHTFLTRILDPSPLARAIATGAQEQIGMFFATDGEVVIHSEPSRFFEVPIVPPLPEDLSYIP